MGILVLCCLFLAWGPLNFGARKGDRYRDRYRGTVKRGTVKGTVIGNVIGTVRGTVIGTVIEKFIVRTRVRHGSVPLIALFYFYDVNLTVPLQSVVNGPLQNNGPFENNGPLR